MARWRERGARWHECLITSRAECVDHLARASAYQTYQIEGGRGSSIISSLLPPAQRDRQTTGDGGRRQRRAALGCARTSVKPTRPRDLLSWRAPSAVVRRCRTGVTGSEQAIGCLSGMPLPRIGAHQLHSRAAADPGAIRRREGNRG